MKKRLLSSLLTLCMVMSLLPTAAFAADTVYGAFTVSDATAASYDNTAKVLTVTKSCTISMADGTTNTDSIKVTGGTAAAPLNITLSGVDIQFSGGDMSTPDPCAFDMTGATVNLTLEGTNTLKSGDNKAGLQAPAGATLTIGGTGELNAIGCTSGAGIGGSQSGAGGTITISGGTVTATGGINGDGGAGIGGGQSGAGGTITISGGTVTATGGAGGAGIGGGHKGEGGNIAINGGTVTVTGGINGAGIGGGYQGAGGTIAINGGTVTASGGSNGAGIGGGDGGAGGTIAIIGGTVTATGKLGGADIGTGALGTGGTTTITGGSVKAKTATNGNINPAPTNGKTPVYLAKIPVNGLTSVNDIKIKVGSVDFNLPATHDSDANFYLYLPGNNTEVTATVGTKTYICTIANNNDNEFAPAPATNPFTVSDATAASYDNIAKVLTVTKSCTISMAAGTASTADNIKVTGGTVGAPLEITLKDVNIQFSDGILGTDGTCAFDMTGATVNLKLEGSNTLKSGNKKAGLQAPAGATLTIGGTGTLNATGGDYGAGIGGDYGAAGKPGGHYVEGGTITINGGTITANGGTKGAGIGCGCGGAGGTITINGGTVTANGGAYGTGIGGGDGGGHFGGDGKIAISGGTVTATGGTSGTGIGGGRGGKGFKITISGGTVTATGQQGSADIGQGEYGGDGGTTQIIGGSIKMARPTNHINTPVPTNGTDGVYLAKLPVNGFASGTAINVKVGGAAFVDFKIPAKHGNDAYFYLYLPTGVAEATLGTKTYTCIVQSHNQSVFEETAAPATSAFTVVPKVAQSVAATYNSTTKVLTVTGDCTISMAAGVPTTDRIVVPSGTTANITLKNVKIDVSATSGACAFYMTGAKVNLTLEGTNTLKSGQSQAGLQAPAGATLTIGGTGTLNATGGNQGAGIGGVASSAGGEIAINGGTVTATGGSNGGAGIGGGNYGAGGEITISGGTVSATGGNNGAGIGGGNLWDGYVGPGGTIAISGGTVTATGNVCGAGIGGGRNGAGGEIAISGGTVSATGGNKGAGIGGGVTGAGGNITISGGTVTATGKLDGADIGIGAYGEGGTTKITGGSVKATTATNGNINPAPTTDGTTAVYLVKLPATGFTSGAATPIKVGSVDFKIPAKHDSDENFYLYLPAGVAEATVGTKSYACAVADNNDNEFAEKAASDGVTTETALNQAIADAPTNGTATTIKLGGNIALNATVTITDKNIILDLNGKKLSSGTDAITLNGTASLEVKDTSAGATGVLSTTGTDRRTIAATGSGTVTISSGTVSAGVGASISNSSSGTVNVSGGTVSTGTGDYAIDNSGTGTVTVSGGTVSSGANAIWSYGGPVTISGGKLGVVAASTLNLSGDPTLTVLLNRTLGGSQRSCDKVNITGELTGADGNITLNGKLLSSTAVGTVVATATNPDHAVVSKFTLMNVAGKKLVKNGVNVELASDVKIPNWADEIKSTTDTWDNGGAIGTAAELAQFAYNVNHGKYYAGKTITLSNGINLSTKDWTPIGADYNNPFKGTFDGQGYKITGIAIGSSSSPNTTLMNVGLFGFVNTGTIKNLGVDVSIHSSIVVGEKHYIGGLVGYINKAAVTKCYATGSIVVGHLTAAGGLIGGSEDSRVDDSYADVKVTGGVEVTVGGLMGENAYNSAITNCYATGSVSGIVVGGLVGLSSYGSIIRNSYATGNLSGGTNAIVGGLAGKGFNVNTVTNCYWNNEATQTVAGTGQTKKGIGEVAGGTVTNVIGMTASEMKATGFVATLNDNVAALANQSLYEWVAASNGYPVFRVPTTTWDNGGAIGTGAELAQFAYNVNHGKDYAGKIITLAANIDLSGKDWTPIGYNNNLYPSKDRPFKGTFDGQGKKITGITIGSSSSPNTTLTCLGLFGCVMGGSIKNLGVEVSMHSRAEAVYAGGLVGVSVGAITNCYATGNINIGETSDSVGGGLVGTNSGAITNCYATANVSGGTVVSVGGLVGYNEDATMTNSYATGDVAIKNSTNSSCGGLVGQNSDSVITNCYWNSDAAQTVAGNPQTKKGVGADAPTQPDASTGKTSSEMKGTDFVNLLNQKVDTLANPALCKWKAVANTYPTFVTKITMSGTIKDKSNNPVSGATVTLTPNVGTPNPATTGTDGKYTIDHVTDGSYTITVTLPNGGGSFTKDVTVPGDNFDIKQPAEATYSVSGTVKDSSNANANGVSVKLMKGNTQIGATTTVADGTFTITSVQNGSYNLVLEKGGIKVTKKVEVKGANCTLTDAIKMPSGKTNSVVEVKPSTPDLVVGGLDRLFDSVVTANDKGFTNADKTLVETMGGSITIKLVAQSTDHTAPNGNDINAAAKAKTKTIGDFMDITVLKKAIDSGNNEIPAQSATLVELPALIEVRIPLAPQLQGKTDYVIYRYHGSKVDEINTSPNTDGECFTIEPEAVTLHIKKFSTYAIAYQTTTPPVTPPSGGHSSSGVASATLTAEQSKDGTITIGTDKKTATVSPNNGYVIADVMVDGKSIGATETYTVVDSKPHKITAAFVKETALPYYTQNSGTVYIGFSALADQCYKYIAPSGVKVEFKENSKKFADNTIAWAKPSIDFVTARELFLGTTQDTFAPKESMTRAMFVTVIGRLYERSYGNVAGTSTFSDVDANAYYAKYVAWATDSGIIKGIGGNKFAPNEKVTREQMAVMMRNVATLLKKADVKVDSLAYPDSTTISSWAIDGAKYCQATKVITGRNGSSFAPQQSATRAEVAVVMERFINTIVK